jgi:transposase
MSSALRTDRKALRALRQGDPLTLQLREASREDEDLKDDFRRLANRLRDLLLRVWPELLRLVPAADEPWFWTLLRYAPMPTAGEALPIARVRRILREHRIRRVSAETVVEVLRTPSVYLAPGVREGVAPRISDLLEQIAVVYTHRREAQRRLETILQALEDSPTETGREHQDVVILQSLPGIGTRITATMLAEAARPLRERDYDALRVLAGIAPVTKRSGKGLRIVQMRRACNDHLRSALRAWAMRVIQLDAPSRAHYDRLRASGHRHDRALRGVVDRLLAVLIAMLRDGTVYDATKRQRTTTAAA